MSKLAECIHARAFVPWRNIPFQSRADETLRSGQEYLNGEFIVRVADGWSGEGDDARFGGWVDKSEQCHKIIGERTQKTLKTLELHEYIIQTWPVHLSWRPRAGTIISVVALFFYLA